MLGVFFQVDAQRVDHISQTFSKFFTNDDVIRREIYNKKLENELPSSNNVLHQCRQLLGL